MLCRGDSFCMRTYSSRPPTTPPSPTLLYKYYYYYYYYSYYRAFRMDCRKSLFLSAELFFGYCASLEELVYVSRVLFVFARRRAQRDGDDLTRCHCRLFISRFNLRVMKIVLQWHFRGFFFSAYVHVPRFSL